MENTNIGFSVGYVLCASYVCSWYQPADHIMVPGTYVQYRATSKKKKNVRLCGCSTNLGFSVENNNIGFSVGYVLCGSYVCTWYQPADHSMVPGTYVQYRATLKKTKKTPGTSERFVANCGVGPSTRGQGDSASLVKPTQDQRR